ncbi:Lipoprotein OS=Streptomyces griseorubiginosus OX=67304 GN=AQJ54_20120 PE=4 SV=1 [Streptomyces griseorubiginosus]
MNHFDIAGLHRRVLGAAALTAGVLLLTGCAGSGDSDDKGSTRQDVASLHSEAPDGNAADGNATAQATPSADDGRPQLRLDSSEEEKDRYWHLYAVCLKDHGHKMLTARGPDSIDQSDHSATAKAATKACANKLPLQPPELDEATNPHYDDDYRAYVKCLNRKGLKVTALPDNSGWTYDGNTTMSAARQSQVDRSCTLEAFRGTTR